MDHHHPIQTTDLSAVVCVIFSVQGAVLFERLTKITLSMRSEGLQLGSNLHSDWLL